MYLSWLGSNFIDIPGDEPPNILSSVLDIPSEMVCAEFVVYAYQQLDPPKIGLNGHETYPMKLEDYLNHHLATDFLFVGVTVVDPEKKKQEEEEELARRKAKKEEEVVSKRKKEKEEKGGKRSRRHKEKDAQPVATGGQVFEEAPTASM